MHLLGEVLGVILFGKNGILGSKQECPSRRVCTLSALQGIRFGTMVRSSLREDHIIAFYVDRAPPGIGEPRKQRGCLLTTKKQQTGWKPGACIAVANPGLALTDTSLGDCNRLVSSPRTGCGSLGTLCPLLLSRISPSG